MQKTMTNATTPPSGGKRARLALTIGFFLPLPFIAAKLGFDGIAANLTPYSALIFIPVIIFSTILWFTLITASYVLLREQLRGYGLTIHTFLLFQLGCLAATSPLLYRTVAGNMLWFSIGIIACSIAFAMSFLWANTKETRRVLISSSILFSIFALVIYLIIM